MCIKPTSLPLFVSINIEFNIWEKNPMNNDDA